MIIFHVPIVEKMNIRTKQGLIKLCSHFSGHSHSARLIHVFLWLYYTVGGGRGVVASPIKDILSPKIIFFPPRGLVSSDLNFS